jgi:Tetrapyrrole (Corrin/Porphyrin) Methylases
MNGTIGLRDYLVRLATEPTALAAFVRDPDAAMDDACLDSTGRDALIAADIGPIWNALLDRVATNGSAKAAHSNGARMADRQRESLIVVGTGICAVGQLTVDAIAYMKESDVVLYLVGDPVAEGVIRRLNPSGAMSLRGYYGEGIVRNQSYEAMVQHILSCVRAGQRTCVAFYGHPGVFAYPAHEAIRRARKEGYVARMLPGISAEDCLFADLNVDPAVNGCQSVEASDFLIHEKAVDTSCALVLWQVGVVGDWTYRTSGYELHAFPLLIEKLTRHYGMWHEVTIYEAATLPELKPKMLKIALGHLTPSYVTAGTTMYVPPARPKTLDPAYGSVLTATR